MALHTALRETRDDAAEEILMVQNEGNVYASPAADGGRQRTGRAAAAGQADRRSVLAVARGLHWLRWIGAPERSASVLGGGGG